MKIKKLLSQISGICLAVVLIVLVGSKIAVALVDGETLVNVLNIVSNIALWALIPVIPAWAYFNWAAVLEFLRKLVVMLKRRPSLIPLVSLAVAFVYYSLNLTAVSDTTAVIQGDFMGLSQFGMMLISMLCMLCMLNAFPKRKKPNIPMVVLVFVMLAILLVCDYYYLYRISYAWALGDSGPLKGDYKVTAYKAYSMLSGYQIMIIVTVVLTATLPLYSKLIRKIKTSVAVEDNGSMAEIEIED